MSDQKQPHEVFITQEKIQERVTKLAKQISKDLNGKQPVLVGILTGSYMLMADLSRALWNEGLTEFAVDFIGFSSYQDAQTSSRTPQQTKKLTIDVKNQDVLLVEDIADTCLSIQSAQKYLAEQNPASLKTMVLLEKPSRHEVKVPLEYVGFKIENVWVEGYGLDSANLGRGRPEIIKRI